MSARVLLDSEGRADFDALPVAIQARVLAVFERLRSWPQVSGAKPLRRAWKGRYRIRTGDWRVIFRVSQADVVVVGIKHRSEAYEDRGEP